jgi:hypothetical protein
MALSLGGKAYATQNLTIVPLVGQQSKEKYSMTRTAAHKFNAVFLRLFPLVAVMLVGVGVGGDYQTAEADGVSPAKLREAGWDCFLPEPPADPDFNRNVHCSPPGQLEGIFSGTAETGMFLAFSTEDPSAESAPLLGTERLIRADKFHGQPCPTDAPSYEYSHLGPLFGLDYYICHSFDSPW